MAARRNEATFPLVVRTNAERYGDRPALIHGDRVLTFAGFDRAAVDAVRAFMAFGLSAGDRVGIWAPNSIDWLVAAMGVLGAGGTILPLNSRLRGAEVARILRRSSASAVITASGFLDDRPAAMLREAGPDLDIPIIDLSGATDDGVCSWPALLASGAVEVPVDAAKARGDRVPRDAACDILFTSGTTGEPKGVATTHAKNMLAWGGDYLRVPQLGPGDRMLLIPPLGLMYGLKAIFMLGTLAGATLVLQSVFSAEATMRAVQDHGITYLPGPPTLFQDVLDSPLRENYDLSTLRHVHVAGTSIPPTLIERIRGEGLAERITVGYGMSECGPVTMTRLGDDVTTIAYTVGTPVAGIRLRLVDEFGAEVGLGQPGEILVKGDWVVDGYYDDPVQTAQAFTADSWLHSGDVGVLDERGYLRIVGRKKEMFIVGGFNVYPAEVERCLMEHEAVADVAVVPLPDDRLGEVGAAFVVPRDGARLDPDELIAWSRMRLANYKAPRLVCAVDALPRNASSKLLRSVLRERAAEMARHARQRDDHPRPQAPSSGGVA
jgi:HIP---CoA ligase